LELEFNVPFQHKYGYIRDELRFGGEYLKSTAERCSVKIVMIYLCIIYIFIHQTGSKNNKTNKYSNFKKNKENLTKRNLTKYYRLMQNLQKQFTVEL